jgi:pilus assembly protein Flp/PilA
MKQLREAPLASKRAKKMARLVGLFLKDAEAATAIEYALIAGGIALAIVAAVTALGTQVNTDFENVSNGFK